MPDAEADTESRVPLRVASWGDLVLFDGNVGNASEDVVVAK